MRPEKYGGGDRDPWYKSHGDSSSSSSSSSGGCFLTTACTAAKGLPDNCDELMTIRRYRDEILLHQVGGRSETSRYYEIAPGIVERINQREDARRIWETVYREMIEPCVSFIKSAKYDQALDLYREYTLQLANNY